MLTIFPLFEWGVGADHSDTKAGRTADAIPLYERTLAGCERVRDANHPDTKAAREGLAALTSKPKRHRHNKH